jgi:hypothetical protein
MWKVVFSYSGREVGWMLDHVFEWGFERGLPRGFRSSGLDSVYCTTKVVPLHNASRFRFLRMIHHE